MINLNVLKRKENKDWNVADLEELVNHISKNFNGELSLSLPKLSKVVRLITRVHGDNHPELEDVYRIYNNLNAKLEEKSSKEEILYPAVKKYTETNNVLELKNTIIIIKELESGNDEIKDMLKELRTAAKEYEIPGDVCGTFESTYHELQSLEAYLFEYISLENNILFPKLKELI